MRTPMLRRNARVRASVFDIDNENASLAAIVVRGTSEPSGAIPEYISLVKAKKKKDRFRSPSAVANYASAQQALKLTCQKLSCTNLEYIQTKQSQTTTPVTNKRQPSSLDYTTNGPKRRLTWVWAQVCHFLNHLNVFYTNETLFL